MSEMTEMKIGECTIEGPAWQIQEILDGKYEQIIAAQFNDETDDSDG